MLNVAIDLRRQLEPIRDQGRRPTCLSFAASVSHRSAHKYPGQLSPEWLYYHATRRDGALPDQGSTIEATCAAIQNDGQPDEIFWPYQPHYTLHHLYQPPGVPSNLLRCATAQCSGNADHWRSEINNGSPIVIAIFISPAFYQPGQLAGAERLVVEDNVSIDQSLAHAVALVGHGSLDGVEHFLVRNSWGPRWGANGYAWLSETYLIRRFSGAFITQKGASGDV
jgi:hypothetical protein